jgi:hypothetical protein
VGLERQAVAGGEVLATGSVVLTDRGNFQLTVSHNGETLVYDFIFTETDDEQPARHQIRFVQPDRCIIELVNFSRSIWLGYDRPLRFSTPGQQVMMMNIVTYSFSNWKVLHYTLWSEAATNVSA